MCTPCMFYLDLYACDIYSILIINDLILSYGRKQKILISFFMDSIVSIVPFLKLGTD